MGPEEGRSSPIVPMEHALRDVHEVAGVGTLFPNAEGQPVLHMHVAAGRGEEAVTGCVRLGVRIWHVLEVVLWELTGTTGRSGTRPGDRVRAAQAVALKTDRRLFPTGREWEKRRSG